MAHLKGREVNWYKTLGTSLCLGGWGCEGTHLISLLIKSIPLESSRKVVSLLRSITGLHLW